MHTVKLVTTLVPGNPGDHRLRHAPSDEVSRWRRAWCLHPRQGIQRDGGPDRENGPGSREGKAGTGIVEEIVAEVLRSVQQNQLLHQKLYELNANYGATLEEFTKILDDLDNNRMRTGTKVLGLRFKMKSMLTAQEWKALSEVMTLSRNRHGS